MGYIEPHNGTAVWNRDGKVTIWTSTQGAFGIRQNVARVLSLPLGDLRVIPAEIGGGFGAKNVVYLEPLAALLSKKAGRPVQITMTRTEVFEATGPTSGTRSFVKLGARRDGTLVAADIRLQYQAGAYPGSPVPGGARCALGSYDVPHQRIVGLDVVLNRPKVAAYRAPGAPAAGFAVEAALDELANMLEMDPMELRQKNGTSEGRPRSDGAVHGSVGVQEVITATMEHPHYRAEITEPNVGRGVAMGFWQNGGGESSAYATVHPDGTATLVTGSVDIGGQRASLAMQFAETMGTPYEDVNSLVGDTDTIGYTGNTGGSRTTFATGWAVYQAALDIREQLEDRVAAIWEVDAIDVTYDPRDAAPPRSGRSDDDLQRGGAPSPRHWRHDPGQGGHRLHQRRARSESASAPISRTSTSTAKPARSPSSAIPRSRMSAKPSTPPTSRARSRAARYRASAWR